jgi:hypothetical protein
MSGNDVLFDLVRTAPGATFTTDAWHGNKYTPALLEAAAGRSVQRYGSPALSSYVAVVEAPTFAHAREAADPAPPGSEFAASGWRGFCESAGDHRAAHAGNGPAFEFALLYAVFFTVPAAREQEFDAWYEEEHLNILFGSPYWKMCRRFRIVRADNAPFTHAALHYLSDLKALESPEREMARQTEWRARLAAEPWFNGTYQLFYRLGASLSRST